MFVFAGFFRREKGFSLSTSNYDDDEKACILSSANPSFIQRRRNENTLISLSLNESRRFFSFASFKIRIQCMHVFHFRRKNAIKFIFSVSNILTLYATDDSHVMFPNIPFYSLQLYGQ